MNFKHVYPILLQNKYGHSPNTILLAVDGIEQEQISVGVVSFIQYSMIVGVCVLEIGRSRPNPNYILLRFKL